VFGARSENHGKSEAITAKVGSGQNPDSMGAKRGPSSPFLLLTTELCLQIMAAKGPWNTFSLGVSGWKRRKQIGITVGW
jgi:hypothetical protein